MLLKWWYSDAHTCSVSMFLQLSFLPSLLCYLLLLLSPASVHSISALSLVERGERWENEKKWRRGQLLVYFSSEIISCQIFPLKVSYGYADPQTTHHINFYMKIHNRLTCKKKFTIGKMEKFHILLLFYTFQSISGLHFTIIRQPCWYFRKDGQNPAHKHYASI